MNISSILDKAARLWPDKEAVVCSSHRLTYSGLAERVARLGSAFSGTGLQAGDRVAVMHSNCHRFLEAYFAAAREGLILVPINVRLSAAEIRSVLEDSGARLLVAESTFAPKVHDALTNKPDERLPVLAVFSCGDGGDTATGSFSGDGGGVSDSSGGGGGVSDSSGGGDTPDSYGGCCERIDYETALREAKYPAPGSSLAGEGETAHLYYTSGSTGRPKGVKLTHSNVAIHALGAAAELGLSDTDVWVHAAPMYHLADAWATFAITMVGGTHVMLPRFTPGLFLDAVEAHRVTLTNLIPTMLNSLVNEPGAESRDNSSLRCLLSGGAPIAPELVRRIIETFRCEYIQTYGLTETSPYLTLSLLKDHMQGLPEEERFRYKSRTGREFITVELKVVRPDGGEVARDDAEVGEILARGPTVSPGYWNRPAETEAAFQDGWLKTGDLAVMDSEGFINIVDRLKDMIITGGENVYSIEVENVLYEHPAVLEAAVVGVRDEKWGEAVRAFVALKPGAEVDADALIRFCKERIADYKAPSSVEFLPSLPKTGSGKIFKKRLREQTGRT